MANNLDFWGLGFVVRIVLGFFVCFVFLRPVSGVRPLRKGVRSWGDEWLSIRKDENEFGPFSAWNITGTYRGSWRFIDSTNSSSRFPDFRKSNGNSIFELVTTPTKINGVHYVQGVIIFHDVFDNEHEVGGAQIRVEGVYIWPFRQLRMVANSEILLDTSYPHKNLHRTTLWSGVQRGILNLVLEVLGSGLLFFMLVACYPEPGSWSFLVSGVPGVSSRQDLEEETLVCKMFRSSGVAYLLVDGDRDRYHIEGLMESPSVDDDGDCFSPMVLNATSVNIEGAAKVSILMIGQQAIMDAYLCLLHLTAGILVESLFNAFATAAFFKFVVFSIFEMRYLLAIWKASRPMNNGEGWEAMRRELSVLYSRFYGILLGGILVMYEFHRFLRPILLLIHSFWIPQIVTNVVRDSRKPLHPHYILGMTITRLAIPLYVFGCPHNFMRIEPDKSWCICLCAFMGFQASILLLQHYLGSRWFIPRQILPEKYSYYRRFDQGANHATDCVICMTAIDITQRSSDCMVMKNEEARHINHDQVRAVAVTLTVCGWQSYS
ncbi:hypothetical protein TEA_006190 [Camellia sinensis var. sinensis]|uniref:RING-type E3 ubiquitin transferase n=1 Tax=Camellia sinensis var. sinensis TaxID=542762 RepID=A0A4V3WLQ1_CAMSN|nr:hypothetical protein TEA_006190 [Camellia sinensis var. sinensis]